MKEKERKLMLVINNLTEKEKLEIINMVKVREIEQRNPDRTIFCQVVGLEDKNIVDAKEGKLMEQCKFCNYNCDDCPLIERNEDERER